MHYVIIGNGVAGITAALAIRKRDSGARISVIGGESDYFVSRTALMYVFMDRMTRRDLEPFERGLYDAERIERIRGWVTRLDAGRNTLGMADGREIRYDRLAIATGSTPNRVEWPGLETAKTGVVHFVSLQDLEACERLVPGTRRAVVVGGGLIGVELVECLIHHGIEVDFLVRDSWYWPMALAKEEGDLIGSHLQRHGVRLHLGYEITGISTDAAGRVQLVHTNQERDFPCQMLGVCIGVRPAIDWLRSVATPPVLGRGIQVTNGFRTSLPDVWAAGDCAEFTMPDGRPLVEQIWYSAKRQGELVAQAMWGEKVEYRPPLFYNSAKLFEMEYTTVGEAADESFYYQLPGKEISIRVMHSGGVVTGFNMLGSRWDHTRMAQWIEAREKMDQVMAQLAEAQFDVEFGRIPMAGAQAAWKAARR